MASVDADNLAWLKNVVAEMGWPGRSPVGEDGAHAVWPPAQHADRDPAFQRKCLELMTEAAERGEASRTDLAYLTDRVLLAEGQPQEYGTQMTGRKEGWVPRRLRDPEHVGERRAAVSLGPLADYNADMERANGPAKPIRIECGGCGGDINVWLPDPANTPRSPALRAAHTQRSGGRARRSRGRRQLVHLGNRRRAGDPMRD